MPAAIDLTGHVYSRLTVINESLPRGRPRKWHCLCNCGAYKTIDGNSLRTGNTTSCGCYNKELITSHGDTGTRLFYCWQAMKQRCTNKNSASYKDYGAIGVTVCSEWVASYEVFKTWALTNGYKNTLTLDRINCSLIYSPDTCRWATKDIQARNQRIRTNSSCEYVGVTFIFTRNRYQASTCVNNKRIHLGTFLSAIEAALARDSYIKQNNLEGFVLNFP